MKIITTEKIPIKMWLEEIEDGAMAQVKNLANLPFAFKHIAIMPDSHQGFGMVIGGVLATKDVIIPSAVGSDIACGVCAVKTSLTEIDKETLKKILGEIRKQIPVGFNKHKVAQDFGLMPKMNVCISSEKDLNDNDFREKEIFKDYPIILREWENALKSLGSLGSGNHFLEIQKGSDGHIWIMIHSGSRNLGKQVADHYNKIAKELNAKWFSSVPKEWDLAFLPIDSEEGQSYIREMNYCVEFALANRKLMMDRICKIFHENNTIAFMDEQIQFDPIINIAHNYARMENHMGQNVMVHRKGATLADENTIGIIPGSLGSSSYIVKGLGNKESFNSCSHGAGRKMGRKDAERRLNLEEEIKKLDDQGIIHGVRNKHDLDEAPGAYKEIDEVMKNQEDLVEIMIKLQPLASIKG